MPDTSRIDRLEERIAWLERHVTEQDKVMLGLGDEVRRLQRELLALREQLAVQSAGLQGPGSPSDERPPHY